MSGGDDMYKKICAVLVLSFLLAVPALAAQKGEDVGYEDARLYYAASNACLAAYDDKVGNVFYSFLQNIGWEVEKFSQVGDFADSNIFLTKRRENGKTFYMLAFRGTASKKDVNVDARTEKLLFAGSTPAEINENAKKTDVPDRLPKVHEGFLQYVLAAFDVDLEDSSIASGSKHLYDIVKEDENAHIVVTGHSLGGAGAVLYAASMVEMGVPTERIKVVTFGAPAVGNKAFANKYKDILDISRIYSVYDPIPGGLQSFFSYVQIGSPIEVRSDPRVRSIQHKMENYADIVGKMYYDSKERAIDDGTLAKEPDVYDDGTGKVTAIVINEVNEPYYVENYKYAREILLDIYRKSFPRYRVLEASADASRYELEQMAKEAGADYLVVAQVDISRVKTTSDWIMELHQAAFDVKASALVSGGSYSQTVKRDGSFFQAAAYNTFMAVKDLSSYGEDMTYHLEYPLK